MPLTWENTAPPLQDAIARPARPGFVDRPDPLAGQVTQAWIEYFTRLGQVVNVAATRVGASTSLTAQAASIVATDISGGGLSIGLYRLSYYARITRAATTSSSLTVTLSWTESGVALSLAGAAMTGNTVTTVQTGTAMILVDNATPVSFATTYASVGATTMQYRLSVVLEQVQV